MSAKQKEKKSDRSVLALDFDDLWKKSLNDNILPIYSNFSTMASLARHVLREFILCHLKEVQARGMGLLANYQTIGRPDVLMSAVRSWEQLRVSDDKGRGEAGDTGVQPQQTPRPKSARGG